MGDLVGQTLSHYHILEQLGEGGMATVYKAYDTRLDREVAVKVVLPIREQSEKFLARFEREAKALARLSHPNIVAILDYGKHQDVPFLVMEYLPGGTLKDVLKGKPLPYQQAAQLLAPIARALAYAHDQKIVHRDVKPSNILITQSGEPMLSDFGIAKLLEIENTVGLTTASVGIGTPTYMSPEQTQNLAIDGRSDIYSLGVVFFEMLTGRKPFEAETPAAVAWKQASEPLPLPRKINSSIPEKIEKILLKALAKNPDDRYQDMQTFAKVIENLGKDELYHPNAKRFSWWMLALPLLIIVNVGFLLNFTKKLHPLPTATTQNLTSSITSESTPITATALIMTKTPQPTATDAFVISTDLDNSPDKPRILFDESHSQTLTLDTDKAMQLLPENPSYLYAGAYRDILQSYYRIDVLETGKFSSEILRNYDVLVLTDGGAFYTQDEIDAIQNFLAQGKGVFFVRVGPGGTMYKLLDPLGISFINWQVASPYNLLGSETEGFKVYINPSSEPILENVTEYTAHLCSGLNIESPASGIIWSGDDTWLDENTNDKQDANEESQSYPLIIKSSFGSGRVIVHPCEGFFDTFPYLNKQLLLNITHWLAYGDS